jgi:two-component system, OmpR family, sensor kinase
VSLRWRLTLTLTLALLGVAFGLGAVLYLLSAREAREAFHLGLQTLAREYARLALEADAVRLREPPLSPFAARLGGVSAWLLEPNGGVRDVLSADGDAPRLSAAILDGVRRGEETVFDLEGRGVAAYPIFDAGTFRLSYVLLVAADDVAGAQGLARLRGAVLGWALAAALLALGVGNALALWLSRPLRSIAQTARAVGQGDLTRRIPQMATRDELGALQRDLNAMLERLEGLVGAHRRFTADAAHDLRTPLSVLRTEVEVALRRDRDAASYRATLERSLTRIESLSALADDLLTLSKLEAGPERVFESFLLRDALEPTLDTTEGLALARGLRFEVAVPLDLEVHGDATLVARLVANLLANAAGFARERFGVRAFCVGDTVQLEVWDDGPGVPEALKPRLFERFSKGERSSGAGLGLAIAHQIALTHGSRLRLEDRPGAVFVCSLSRDEFRFALNSNAGLTQEP